VNIMAPKKKQKLSEEIFDVEEIIGSRMHKGVKQWKVKWRGYPQSFNSWEPMVCFNEQECSDLLKKYDEEHPMLQTNQQDTSENRRKNKRKYLRKVFGSRF